jgi:hypothetical protein
LPISLVASGFGYLIPTVDVPRFRCEDATVTGR